MGFEAVGGDPTWKGTSAANEATVAEPSRPEVRRFARARSLSSRTRAECTKVRAVTTDKERMTTPTSAATAGRRRAHLTERRQALVGVNAHRLAPQIPLADRLRPHAEDLACLTAGEPLEVPQCDDLPVDFVHAIERRLQAGLRCGFHRHLAGRQLIPNELLGDGAGVRGRPQGLVQRDLAHLTSLPATDMVAVDVDQFLGSDCPEPGRSPPITIN